MNETYHCPRCRAPIDPSAAMCQACGCTYNVDNGRVLPTGHVCFACGHQTDQIGDFCPECRQQYQVTCNNCGAVFRLGQRVCPQCGQDPHESKPEPIRPTLPKPPQPSEEMPALTKMVVAGVIAFFVVGTLVWLAGLVDKSESAIVSVLAILLFLVSIVVFAVKYSRAKWTNYQRVMLESEPMVVYRTYSVSEAEMLRAALENAEIPAMVINQYANSVIPVPAMGGIQIKVPSDRLDEAREVVKAFGFGDESDENK